MSLINVSGSHNNSFIVSNCNSSSMIHRKYISNIDNNNVSFRIMRTQNGNTVQLKCLNDYKLFGFTLYFNQNLSINTLYDNKNIGGSFGSPIGISLLGKALLNGWTINTDTNNVIQCFTGNNYSLGVNNEWNDLLYVDIQTSLYFDENNTSQISYSANNSENTLGLLTYQNNLLNLI